MIIIIMLPLGIRVMIMIIGARAAAAPSGRSLRAGWTRDRARRAGRACRRAVGLGSGVPGRVPGLLVPPRPGPAAGARCRGR